MKKWIKYLIGLVVVIIVGFLIYLAVTKEEKYFDKVELPKTTMVLNRSPHNYLDSIVYVGVYELNLTPQVIYIKELTDDNQPKGDIEDLELQAYIQSKGSQYIIWIRKMNRSKYLKVLSHELIHLEQHEQGRYEIYKDRVVFEGVTYTVGNIPDYMDRPWEKEAYSRQHKLQEKIENRLYLKK